MLQAGELVIIILLALVLLGPQRLPETARKIGGWVAEIRKAAQELTEGVQAEVRRAAAPLDEVRRDLAETVGDIPTPRFEWTGPTVRKGPSPDDAMADLEEIEKSDQEGTSGAREAGE